MTGDWLDNSPTVHGIEMSFGAPHALDGAEVLYAQYEYGNYSGEAYVLFERNGSLYEVFAAHCSCYGLEDQWDPEQVTAEFILRSGSKHPKAVQSAIRAWLN